jgi:hypothetical protein
MSTNQSRVPFERESPWIRAVWLHHGERILARFIEKCKQLLALPRNTQRWLTRRWRTSLAGIALALALTGAPGSLTAAPAGTIVVDGTTCTLANAITSANTDTNTGGCTGAGAPGEADIIDLQTDVMLSSLLPQVVSEITLNGNDHFIDGASSFRVLNVSNSGDLTLNDVTIQNGSAPSGGGIYNGGTVTVNNSTISGNYASSFGGGGIFNRSGTVTVNNSTLSGNLAFEFGGGIYNRFGSTMTVSNSIISGNRSSGYYSYGSEGGGIFNYGTMTVSSSTLSYNRAGYGGGGGICNRGTMTVSSSTLSGNTAEDNGGGGIYNNGTMTVSNSTLSGNTADGGGISDYIAGFGGGIRNSGTMTVNNSTISDNYAGSTYSYGSFGGGIYNRGTMTVSSSTISGNWARNSSYDYDRYTLGGGIANSGTVTVTNSTLSGNSANFGGGIFNGGIFGGTGSTATFSNSTLSGNSAFGGADGGGIFNDTGNTATFSNSIVANSLFASGECAGITPPTFTYSLVEDGSCSVTDGIDGNKTGDPQLGPLADNGGPTLTHTPNSASSPVVDTGSNALVPAEVTTDQRGFERIWDGGPARSPAAPVVDMGSVEFDAPTAVTLVALTAVADAQGNVTIAWETAVETDNAGFNIYRSPLPEFDPVSANRINPELIAAQGSLGQGASYAFVETGVIPGNWYYTLEDVDLSGVATLHGPVQVDTTAPTAVSATRFAGQSTMRSLPAVLLAIMASVVLFVAERKRRVRFVFSNRDQR